MAKQSLLSDFHKSNGAVFIEREGWLLPDHFGDPLAEYRAMRSTVGLIDRCHRGLLQFTGPDRLSFLQGMLSNDLRTIEPGQGQYATVLNQQGRVLGDVRVLRSENSFYLDLWEVIKDKIVAHLNRYLVADEVEIADRSQDYAILSVQGPRCKELLQKLLGQVELPRRPVQHIMADIGGAEICVVRVGPAGQSGFDLIIPIAALQSLARRATDAGEPLSARWVGEEAQNILRVEAGMPRYGVDFDEDNLLLETGLDNAVSFTKGCYLGQEVVERIHSRGHVNKKLVGLRLDGQLKAEPGDRVMRGDKEIGMVSSSVNSPELGSPIALAYVHRDFWDAGRAVEIEREGSLIPAEITRLPFVSGENGLELS